MAIVHDKRPTKALALSLGFGAAGFNFNMHFRYSSNVRWSLPNPFRKYKKDKLKLLYEPLGNPPQLGRTERLSRRLHILRVALIHSKDYYNYRGSMDEVWIALDKLNFSFLNECERMHGRVEMQGKASLGVKEMVTAKVRDLLPFIGSEARTKSVASRLLREISGFDLACEGKKRGLFDRWLSPRSTLVANAGVERDRDYFVTNYALFLITGMYMIRLRLDLRCMEIRKPSSLQKKNIYADSTAGDLLHQIGPKMSSIGHAKLLNIFFHVLGENCSDGFWKKFCYSVEAVGQTERLSETELLLQQLERIIRKELEPIKERVLEGLGENTLRGFVQFLNIWAQKKQ